MTPVTPTHLFIITESAHHQEGKRAHHLSSTTPFREELGTQLGRSVDPHGFPSDMQRGGVWPSLGQSGAFRPLQP